MDSASDSASEVDLSTKLMEHWSTVTLSTAVKYMTSGTTSARPVTAVEVFGWMLKASTAYS